MDLAEELREAGSDNDAYALTSALTFDPERCFNEMFSKVTSKSLRVKDLDPFHDAVGRR